MTNLIFKTVLSMSVSGTLLILLLLGEKRLFKNTCSRQWQYYIWLIVILRLLLPFGPNVSLMGSVSQAVGRAAGLNILSTAREDEMQDAADFAVPSESLAQEIAESGQEKKESAVRQEPQRQGRRSAEKEKLEGGLSVFLNAAGLLWLAAALGIFVRKITAYQSFVRYVAAGAKPVSDIAFLDALSVMTKRMGIGRPVELCVNPLLSSPTLTGIFHPCIVLPCADISQKDFSYIAAHELTHCKRWDILYKWLVQAVVCMHWFNPFVYVLGREIANACEFSCDEAVLAKMGYENAGDYGKTLLNAMAAVGKYRESSTAVTLSANKELLKERLGAIMACGKKSGKVVALTAVLTVGTILGMVCIGIYPTEPKVSEASEPVENEDIFAGRPEKKEVSVVSEKREEGRAGGTVIDRAEQFYEGGNLPMFQLAFGRMDEETQEEWLDKFYRDDEIAFFSAALEQLKAGSPLIQCFAGKAYEDGSYSFFSALADHMEEDAIEEWLDRATADQTVGFQSLLVDRLGLEDEKDAWEKEWEKELDKKQLEEYRAAGVTKDEKNYYYQGQLVNIFLDMRPDSSFYTLDINPAGVVNVKIARGEDGQVTGAEYLSEEEFAELFGGE